MKIACHFAIPEPPLPELDAAVQDGMKLVEKLGGEVNYFYPSSNVQKIMPRFFCGFHQLAYLRKLDQKVDFHQIFSNGIYPYPVINFFVKPVVFTSIINVRDTMSLMSRLLLKRVRRFVVITENDKVKMKKVGLDCDVILPGIELEHFSVKPFQGKNKFIILVGSAPWNEEQFASKGIDTLLQVAKMLPWLHLVFLWRGKMLEEMFERVRQYGVSKRVTLIPHKVDVNEMMGTVHAAIVLADRSEIVKAYPHSLLEALAAGRPVIVSRCLAMADFVMQHKCGVVVDSVEVSELVEKITLLRLRHHVFAIRIKDIRMDTFSQENMIAAYLKIYQEIS